MTTLGMGGRLHAGGSNEWYTPPHIFEALDLGFDLDPCAAKYGGDFVPAERKIRPPADGLAEKWLGKVWLNPPYGNEAKQWVDRLNEHGNGVALVFVRTDPKWGQRALAACQSVCFISGRLRFIAGHDQQNSANNSPIGSMLLGYGECAEAVYNCGLGVTFNS